MSINRCGFSIKESGSYRAINPDCATGFNLSDYQVVENLLKNGSSNNNFERCGNIGQHLRRHSHHHLAVFDPQVLPRPIAAKRELGRPDW